MKKMVIAALSAVIVAGSAVADVTVKFPAGQAKGKYEVRHMLTTDLVKPRKERPEMSKDSVAVANDAMTIKVDPSGNSNYIIPMGGREAIQFYTSPGDNLVVEVKSLSPLDYTVKGSKLMDGIYTLLPKANDYIAKYRELAQAEQRDTAAMNGVIRELTGMYKNYIKENPMNPASLFAISQLDSDDFMAAFNAIDESLKNTPYYPLLESQKANMERQMAADRHRAELQSGNVDAPNFTFKNLEGKDVSLSDFKGKWVVIDFWGAWCPWCIKGFPALKDAYEQYKTELEVIGIDCNDSEQAWRDAVKKYELPWVQVRNPQQGGESQVLTDYAVQGFPTKVIVSPEGKIANITVGEDPSFFDVLAKFINGKK